MILNTIGNSGYTKYLLVLSIGHWHSTLMLNIEAKYPSDKFVKHTWFAHVQVSYLLAWTDFENIQFLES